jgi:hypothetical protein
MVDHLSDQHQIDAGTAGCLRDTSETKAVVNAGKRIHGSALGAKAPCPAGTVEEPAYDCKEFRFIEKESIMTFVSTDLSERHSSTCRIQRVHDGP